MFEEINECVQYHAEAHNVNFAKCKMYSRPDLVKAMAKVYNLHAMKPTLNRVTLSDAKIAVVPTFDVKTQLLLILNDPSQMRPENIALNYDIFTGMPKEPSDELGEIHTGWAWEKARQFYCGDKPDVVPVGLVCFYDKTHSDLFGSLVCAPLMCVPHFSTKHAK
jgi:hypothetical protein